MERGTDVNILSAASAVTRLSGSVARGISIAVGSAVSGITGLFRRPSTRIPPRNAHHDGKLNLGNVPLPRTTDEYWDESILEDAGSTEVQYLDVHKATQNDVGMDHAEGNGAGRMTRGEVLILCSGLMGCLNLHIAFDYTGPVLQFMRI